MNAAKKLVTFVKKETVLCIAGLLAVVSMFIIHPSADYFGYIDYRVLALLFCFMADVAALYSQTDLGADGEKTMKLKTFAVPVNLKWSFGLGSMLGAYIAAGPQFDFNIGNKTWTRELSLKKSTTSFNVGAGLKLIRHLQLGVNYNFALSKTGTYEYYTEGGSGDGLLG